MDSDRLPPLKSLQVFEAVARTGSVVRAADALHVTQGAVSKQLRLLEAELGVALFERRNRGVYLTAAGAELQHACAQAMQMLAQGVQAVRRQAEAGPLVLSCEPTLAMHWLIPRLALFQATHPQIRLHLVAAGGAVDFVRDRVDLAIRRNDSALQPEWQVHTLAAEFMGPVAAPVLASQRTRPATARKQSAAAWTALHSHSRPGAWPQWLAQQRGAKKRWVADMPAMWLEHFYLCLQAALSGLGVAMASVYMADAAVQAGALQAPQGWLADGSQYLLIQAGSQHQAAALLVADWLRQQMRQTQAQHGLHEPL